MTAAHRVLLASILATFACTPLAARADSPLTSTPFHTAYGDHPVVVHARGVQTIDSVTMHRLRDPSIPHDVRAAIVNALGWRYYDARQSPRAHARTFLRYVANAHRKPADQLRIEDVTTEDLLALGYLAAMDRYHDLAPIGGGRGPVQLAQPRALLAEAARRAPGDRTIATVRALVLAQAEIERGTISDGDRIERGFCRVWRTYEEATSGPASTDLRPQARQVVDSYMHGYRRYCRAN